MPYGGGPQAGFGGQATSGFPPGAQVPPGGQFPTGQVAQPQIPGALPLEASYIENILRLNKGKLATAHFSFEGNNGAEQLVVKGIVEAAGRNHVILSDPQTGRRWLMLMVYLNYVTFDEEIEYEYPFNGAQMAMYTTR